jgi:hypothetical protein
MRVTQGACLRRRFTHCDRYDGVSSRDAVFVLWKGAQTDMLYIGLDDTDVLDSYGTGHIARDLARALSADYPVVGVTRHQLLVDPRVPYTKNNSCSAVLLDASGDAVPKGLTERVRAHIQGAAAKGSDPGLCIAALVPAEITAFGRRVQREVVTQVEARALAEAHGLFLVGLGGDEDGVIGALSAVGLAGSGNDGRYVLVGRSRNVNGLLSIPDVLAVGISAVQTVDGEPVTEGLVQTDHLRPVRREHRPILVVERVGDHWMPLKLDR